MYPLEFGDRILYSQFPRGRKKQWLSIANWGMSILSPKLSLNFAPLAAYPISTDEHRL